MALPPLPDTFEWTQEAWGPALRCRPLRAVAAHLFTTRQLPLTDPASVQTLGTALGAGRVAMVTQVHKAGVVRIRAGEVLEGRPEADVLVSTDPEVAIAVRAADCVPILIADRVSGSVAAVHAGWRGTAARVAQIAVQAMSRECGSDPQHLIAAIGPSICGACYEVGSELVDAFAAAGHERHLIARWFTSVPPRKGETGRSPLHLDVAGANRDQLVLAGVPEERIHLSGLCTAEHLNLLTSFRAEKEGAVRIAGAIVAPRFHPV